MLLSWVHFDRVLVITGEGEDLQRLVLYSYMLYLETMFRTCTRISREKKRFVRSIIVLDLAGFSFSTLVNIGLVTALVKMGTANFPELTDKVFIVVSTHAIRLCLRMTGRS